MIAIGARISKFRQFTLISVFMVLIFYLVYHTINGERGIIAFLKLSQQVSHATDELELVRADRLHLEHRVNLMRPDSIDLDLLDEQARKILGYSNNKEAIYMIDDGR
jgi:cell division protein FtsB